MATKKTTKKTVAKKASTGKFAYTENDDNYLSFKYEVDSDVPFNSEATALADAQKGDYDDGTVIQVWQLVSSYKVNNPIKKYTLTKLK